MDRITSHQFNLAWHIRTWVGGAAIAGILIGLSFACDDKRDPVLNGILPTTSPATAPVVLRPTTQQLLEDKRKEIVLGSFPLSLEVPPTWKLTAEGSGTWLEGECPSGDIRIHLFAQGAQIKIAALLAMEKRERERAATQPETLEVVPLKPIGGPARKMERREILRNLAIVRDGGVTEHVDRVDWSIMVFVPKDDGFDVDELNFSGLPLDLYQKDREFIEHILRSLRYDATGGALK